MPTFWSLKESEKNLQFPEDLLLQSKLDIAKLFSAIFDSNITTIMAALILIQFDSGPIKGFAVSLIIGIISSMFTALFMTRYFFAGWVQNPKNKELNMSQFIGGTHFDFLANAKRLSSYHLSSWRGTFFFIEQRNTIFGMDFTGVTRCL